MRNTIALLITPLLLLNCTNETKNDTLKDSEQLVEAPLAAPDCKKIPKELIAHNDTRLDNYYWLNDRENEEVIDYLNRETNIQIVF